jgi:hypothetical protein
VLEGAYVARQHCGSGVVGGHPPAKIAICAGTRLLAGVAPASTNAKTIPVKTRNCLKSRKILRKSQKFQKIPRDRLEHEQSK